MVIVQCSPIYRTEDANQVSRNSNQRWQSYSPDKSAVIYKRSRFPCTALRLITRKMHMKFRIFSTKPGQSMKTPPAMGDQVIRPVFDERIKTT